MLDSAYPAIAPFPCRFCGDSAAVIASTHKNAAGDHFVRFDCCHGCVSEWYEPAEACRVAEAARRAPFRQDPGFSRTSGAVDFLLELEEAGGAIMRRGRRLYLTVPGDVNRHFFSRWAQLLYPQLVRMLH